MAAAVLILGASPPARASSPFRSVETIRWPDGTELVVFQNLEGVMLTRATMTGPAGADTSGPFVLDTGAGYLAIDIDLARRIGIVDSSAATAGVGIATRPLPRFQLGALSMDQVEPVLTIDATIVRRVTDHPVLGLLGYKPLRDRAVWIDYRAGRVALIPSQPIDLEPTEPAFRISARALEGVLSSRAVPVAFRLAGDGKVLVQARLGDPRPPAYTPWLWLVVDTGASKCVLFEEVMARDSKSIEQWPALRGLEAPTLLGVAPARIVRIQTLELMTAARSKPRELKVNGVDAAVIRSELQEVLTSVTRETIHGLIGYSLLRRYRVVFDYPRHVLWLDPIPGYRDDRPYEYSQVGIQLERAGALVRVTAVALGSPAAEAGIRRGDEIVTIDGAPARGDLAEVAKRLEGPPGSEVRLVVRQGATEQSHSLKRRRLL